jgi:hypothetical protein
MSVWNDLKTLVLSLFIAVLLTACGSSSSPDSPPEIDHVSWIMENIDQSFWVNPVDRSAYINFGIYFTSTDLVASDIESVVLTAPTGRFWIHDDPAFIAASFDPDRARYGGMWRLYSHFYTSNASVLPIGNYNFEVNFTTGERATFTQLVPSPGSAGTDSFFYVYTEDYSLVSSPPVGFTALPLRAAINSAVLDTSASQLTVDFSIDDPRIYSGKIWLYDASRNYIGTIDWFRNFATGTVLTTINSGTTIANDGTSNVVTLTDTQIQFKDGNSMNDIYSLNVVLTDGAQYAGDDRSYDARSISANTLVTIK